ncbi:uncharacterized protein N7506_002003 [Penicillium brevicompactum]|uniref:uncharacterized protein n=1 Tax=Penicillium brevicompactum TaxID=5074 RepID=UPI00253FA414|nr:uncharacterized protein N7506_002003 [Penicillium brevicompactum]KAJ5348750.1 hypothetical protein N7506_002003 [Penicillium brevicompactum]
MPAPSVEDGSAARSAAVRPEAEYIPYGLFLSGPCVILQASHILLYIVQPPGTIQAPNKADLLLGAHGPLIDFLVPAQLTLSDPSIASTVGHLLAFERITDQSGDLNNSWFGKALFPRHEASADYNYERSNPITNP